MHKQKQERYIMESNNKVIAGLIILALIIGGVFIFSSGDNNEEADNNSSTIETSQLDNSPAENQSTIVELAQSTDSLSTLVAAVVEANLVETLNSAGPFTVFAPTNDAFGALLAELDITAEQLLARDDLATILTYHVVEGEVFSTDLRDGQVVETVQGETLIVSVGDTVTLTDANGNVSTVVSADIDASNGVVHVIDRVLLP